MSCGFERFDALRFQLLFVLALGVSLWGCSSADQPTSLRLATTTSTQNSGLMEYLIPEFEERHHVKVKLVVSGTGQALELGRRGDVDVVLVHARERELEFVANGYGVERREIMWNDFVIVGPPADPADVAHSKDVADAMRRIASTQSPFMSRGDDSGTHIRELGLWRKAGVTPAVGAGGYGETGLGMGKTLLIAQERQAYTLVDRGTWLSFVARLDLEVLWQGGRELRNDYGAIRVAGRGEDDPRAEASRALLEFLVSPIGQDLIEGYRVDGQVLFHGAARNRG